MNLALIFSVIAVCVKVLLCRLILPDVLSVLYLNISFCLPFCSLDSHLKVHLLRSVDNLFVVVEEYDHYQFKESKVAYIQLYFIVYGVKDVVVRVTNAVSNRRRH